MDIAPPPMPRLAIPLAYAGVKVDAWPEGLDVLPEADRPFYRTHNGYAVPYYESTEKTKARRDIELVSDRASQFFELAEPDLNLRMTQEKLQEALNDYDQCDDPIVNRIRGRFLVGAMINRMERLARAYFQGNIDGIGLEFETGEDYELTPEQQNACSKEFKQYYYFLVTNDEPMAHVRLRQLNRNHEPSPDHDGTLLDLVREMGKPFSYPEATLRNDIVEKIGKCMEAIDEVGQSLQDVSKHPRLRQAIAQGMRKTLESMGVQAMPPGTEIVQYRSMLQELTDYCRARSGIKREDMPNQSPVRERISYLLEILHGVHHEFERIAHRPGYGMSREASVLMNDGMQLMFDMAASRLPRNASAQDIRGKQANPGHDMSSVGRFRAQADAWIHRDRGRTPD